MTVVVGFNWLEEMMMIGDTRVSWKTSVFWPGTSRPPTDILRTRDCLKKLYKIESPRSPGKVAVLGFCCNNIYGAKTVIMHLGKHKFQNYRRHLVMKQLKDELHRWIEEVTVTELEPEERDNLKFMLCGIEPSRHPPVKRDNKVVGFVSFPEAHIYVYEVAKDSGKVTVRKHPTLAVIGSGAKLEKEIRKQVNQAMRFGFGYPYLYRARAFAISSIISLMFEDNKSIKDIGGPFQTIRITPTGLESDYAWPLGAEPNNWKIQEEGVKTKIYSPATGEVYYTLYPIWEL